MNMEKRYLVWVAVLVLSLARGVEAKSADHVLRSPNEKLALRVDLAEGTLNYALSWQGQPVIAPSGLGIEIEQSDNAPWKIKSVNRRTIDERWKPVVGKRSTVENRCNEMTVSLARPSKTMPQMDVVFRAYDGGVAFRYVLKGTEGKPLVVAKDLSELNFTSDLQAWSYAGERRPLGPEKISAIKGKRKYPVVMKGDGGYWLVVTEAALSGVDNFDLSFSGGKTAARVHMDASRVELPATQPWRVIMLSDNPAAFVDSDMLVNLSPEPTGDFSWVKPGVALWDWRAWGHQAKDGFRYGLEIESWKRFIDFAEEMEIPYLLLDANWYGPEHSDLSDPFKGGKAAQVREALDYGRENGVGLILYLNDKASVNFDIEQIAKAYADWGAVGIKYGFMKGGNQQKVLKTERIVKACAQNKLLVNFHDGPIPPTGHERTWPNWNTREYIHAQSDAKQTHLPSDFILMAYLNTIAGPVDGNHGMFDHEKSMAERPRMFAELYSTIVAEAARTLILYSGLTVVPDSPDSYREHLELFRFIAAQKQPWRQSRTLSGEFGQWITTMRQTRDGVFLVASATDENARTIEIPLDFLGSGSYDAVVYEDAPDAHYKTNRDAFKIRHKTVVATDVIQANLAPGGGLCMIIREK